MPALTWKVLHRFLRITGVEYKTRFLEDLLSTDRKTFDSICRLVYDTTADLPSRMPLVKRCYLRSMVTPDNFVLFRHPLYSKGPEEWRFSFRNQDREEMSFTLLVHFVLRTLLLYRPRLN